MASKTAVCSFKPRETRINVVVPARLRFGARWSDACILNVSARGVLIHTREAAERGSYVELRRGEQVIVGRVMWRSGSRIGLRAQDRVPVGQSSPQRRRKRCACARLRTGRSSAGAPPANVRESRLRGRAMEFVSVAVIGASLSIAVVSMMAEALAHPLSQVTGALGGQAAFEANSR